MKLSIGLEYGAENEAIGMVVPAIYVGSYSCISAADTEDEILINLQQVIALILDDMVEHSPELIGQIHDQGIRKYQADSEWLDFKHWMAIEFDVEAYLKRSKRHLEGNDANIKDK